MCYFHHNLFSLEIPVCCHLGYSIFGHLGYLEKKKKRKNKNKTAAKKNKLPSPRIMAMGQWLHEMLWWKQIIITIIIPFWGGSTVHRMDWFTLSVSAPRIGPTLHPFYRWCSWVLERLWTVLNNKQVVVQLLLVWPHIPHSQNIVFLCLSNGVWIQREYKLIFKWCPPIQSRR